MARLKEGKFATLAVFHAAFLTLIWPTWRCEAPSAPGQGFPFYLWMSHENIFPAFRIHQMCEMWQGGGPWTAPWSADAAFGYGWPFFTFYAPFGYYAGALFHFCLGASYGMAARLSFYASWYLSGLMMYFLAFAVLPGASKDATASSESSPAALRQPSGAWWALAVGLAYMAAPYHLTDIFTRGSLAECWFWAALPALILGFEVGRRRPATGFLIAALAGYVLFVSHNVLPMYGSLLAAVYGLLTARSWRWLALMGAAGTLGAIMAAHFWYPALKFLPLVSAQDVNVMSGGPAILRDHALYWRQFFIEQYGAAGSVPGPYDGMAINQGIVLMTFAILSLAALALPGGPRPGLSKGERRHLAIVLALAGVSMLAMTRLMPWQAVPGALRYIQFPWRLLVLSSFTICLATAMASKAIERWLHPVVAAGLALALVSGIIPMKLLIPFSPDISDATLLACNQSLEQERQTVMGCALNEYLPSYVSPQFLTSEYNARNPAPDSRLTVLSGPMRLESFSKTGAAYAYRYAAPADILAQIHVFDFPGWVFEIDGQPQPSRLGRTGEGLVKIALPSGEHTARLRYDLPPEGRTGMRISEAGMTVWLLALLFSARQSLHARRRRQIVRETTPASRRLKTGRQRRTR